MTSRNFLILGGICGIHLLGACRQEGREKGKSDGIKEMALLCERDNKRLWDLEKVSFLSTPIFFSSASLLPVPPPPSFPVISVSQLKEYCNYIQEQGQSKHNHFIVKITSVATCFDSQRHHQVNLEPYLFNYSK